MILLSGAAFAQQIITPAPWTPMGDTVALTAQTTGNDRVQIFSGSESPSPITAKVCNRGSVDAFVRMGLSTVTVSTSNGTLVTAGFCIPLAIANPQQQYLAGITASSTTLSIQPGNGTIASSIIS